MRQVNAMVWWRWRSINPKAWLAGVLVFGFAVSLPLWMWSSPEDKQRLTQSTVTRLVKRDVPVLDIKPAEQAALKRMVEPETEAEKPDFEQIVWVEDMARIIRPWVSSMQEAETIARWVYVYSVRFDLDPDLVLAVIAVESQFDHFAVSNVGALGLMQVMPFWKEKLGQPNDNLLDIETNLRYGCAIIRYYLDRYKRLDRALAAYNGSLGNRKYPNKVFAAMKRFKAAHASSRT